ncbi:hypothetical protein BP50_001263 [Kingella potus DSM 18304]
MPPAGAHQAHIHGKGRLKTASAVSDGLFVRIFRQTQAERETARAAAAGYLVRMVFSKNFGSACVAGATHPTRVAGIGFQTAFLCGYFAKRRQSAKQRAPLRRDTLCGWSLPKTLGARASLGRHTLRVCGHWFSDGLFVLCPANRSLYGVGCVAPATHAVCGLAVVVIRTCGKRCMAEPHILRVRKFCKLFFQTALFSERRETRALLRDIPCAGGGYWFSNGLLLCRVSVCLSTRCGRRRRAGGCRRWWRRA